VGRDPHAVLGEAPPIARAYAEAEEMGLSGSEMGTLTGERWAKVLGRCYPANRRLDVLIEGLHKGQPIRKEPAFNALADGVAVCHCQSVDTPGLTYMLLGVAIP
jgi:hypothetical protein